MAKSIGIIGGLSPQSTIEFYRHLIDEYFSCHGDHSYPDIIIYSVCFEDFKNWTASGRWDLITGGLVSAGKKLEAADAEFIVIPTNTVHGVFNEVKDALNVPMISIVDATSDEIAKRELSKVGLLGTKYTMEAQELYPNSLVKHGVKVLTPVESERNEVSRIIYEELVQNKILESSKQFYLNQLKGFTDAGAEGVILGCTEIPLLIDQSDTDLIIFDTTKILAEAVLEYSTHYSGA